MTIEIFIAILTAFALGFLCGLTRRDTKMNDILIAETERGNHWYDKYTSLAAKERETS